MMEGQDCAGFGLVWSDCLLLVWTVKMVVEMFLSAWIVAEESPF